MDNFRASEGFPVVSLKEDIGVSSSHLKELIQGSIFVLVCVDDILITGDNHQDIEKLKDDLHKSFQMKDLGLAAYFLGLEISKGAHGHFLSQQKYIQDLIEVAGLTNDKKMDTPLELNIQYGYNDGGPISDPTLYWKLLGSFVYLTITHPDVAHAVHAVSQFPSDPCKLRLTAILSIIRYLRSTSTLGLSYLSTSPPEVAILCPMQYLLGLWPRCLFLEHVIGLTGLSNVQVLCDRAEDSVSARIWTSEKYLM